ncbi:hypothetical protein HYPSUDRAFT_1036436 [Hypholoma sublateritium FD-334 SS-4]|uniref:Uncharacterized protein n=1 Tax=Hypholoma sublateritium (strain FD-334 SS-4) TaxID=945553 RepID=A0A0D2MSE0_HYPSF|nr:hypothetical protein HYPSUDRAFT_1036436 [Hypholoma sublateritium FD-334 SS-4]
MRPTSTVMRGSASSGGAARSDIGGESGRYSVASVCSSHFNISCASVRARAERGACSLGSLCLPFGDGYAATLASDAGAAGISSSVFITGSEPTPHSASCMAGLGDRLSTGARRSWEAVDAGGGGRYIWTRRPQVFLDSAATALRGSAGAIPRTVNALVKRGADAGTLRDTN